MRILPRLSERFGVNVSELLDMPIGGDFSDLSEDEAELLTLYRKTNVLPKKVRRALRQTLETTINMYLSLGESEKKNKTKAKKSAEK
jgi:hypothetical protein